jgi:uncharacterized protein YceK
MVCVKVALLLVLFLTVIALASGCGSLGMHPPHEAPGLYGGVRTEIKFIGHPPNMTDSVVGHIPRGVIVTGCIIDLPFSAALDTLFLPIDLTYHKPKNSSEPSGS